MSVLTITTSVHHVAVIIRFHRTNVHGAATIQAEVHGLHELDIVVFGQRLLR